MNDVERRVLDAIDLDGLVECLRDLVAFPSLGGEETPVQEHVAAGMESDGLAVDRWEIDLDALRRHPAYTVEIERERALGVVGRLGAAERSAGPRLVLNAHADVVPAGEPERWTRPAWDATVENGRVYGRGTADTKGGLACARFALRALRDAEVELAGSVLIQSVVGEEDGGMGTLASIERGHVGDAAIVLEPTSLAVAPAQAGALNFRLTVPGRAAHGALRAEGVSPLDAFLPVHRALLEFERVRNDRAGGALFADYELPFALCFGKLRSGIWASTVAESLVCEGRLGVRTDEDPEEARRSFTAVVEEAARSDPWLREHPPRVEWWGAQYAPAHIPTDHPIVSTMTGAFRSATGGDARVQGMPYGADMRLLVHQGGTPTVIFGPGDVRHAHAPDEFVLVSELEAAVRTLALAALSFCGGAAR